MTRIDKYDWPLVAYFELLNYFDTFWLEEEVPVLGGGTAAGEIPARGTRVERQQKHTEAYRSHRFHPVGGCKWKT